MGDWRNARGALPPSDESPEATIRRIRGDSPTPAAPAGSGASERPKLTDEEYAALEWLDAECHSGPLEARALRSYLRAQRAAREAAERERDEALERERRWQDGFEQRLAAAESVIVEAKAALSASTEREAGLREVAETALSRWKWDIAGPEAVPTRISLDEIDKLRDRLASLAAPEGGTSRPTPPEGT